MKYRFSLAPLAATLLLLAAAPRLAQAQTSSVGIGTTAPDASAALDIVSSSKGLLLPRVAAASAIASPAPGLLVYQTGGTPGFYYNSGTAANPTWQRLATAGSGTADNLGNHTATQTLNLNGQKLTGGGPRGLRVRPGGGVVIDTLAGTGQGRLLTVAPDGTLQASAPIQGQGLTSAVSNPQSLGTAATGGSPVSVALNAAGTRAYVVSANGRTLQTYDVSSGGVPVALGSPAATGGFPSSVVLNAAGTRAYVLIGNTLQAYDVSGSGTPVALGSPAATGSDPRSLAVNAAGTRAYVVNVTSNMLRAFDLSGGAPVPLGSPVATGTGPVDVAVNAAGTRVYVVNADRNTLQTYDVSGGGAPVPLGSPVVTTGSGPWSVALSAAGTRAYVVSVVSNTLQTYDLGGSGVPVALGSPAATGSFPSSVALNAAGTRACVVNQFDNTLYTYDVRGATPVPLGSPVATDASPLDVAVNAAGTRAYVVNEGSNSLQVFDLGPLPPAVVGIGPDGSLGTLTLSQLADNLGNHTATRNLDLGAHQLVGNGGTTGLAIANDGHVGIGTSSPDHPLTVKVDRSGRRGLLGFTDAFGTDKYNFGLEDDGLNLSESNVAAGRLFVQNGTGNVGIGTTIPDQKLEVAGGIKISGAGNGLTFPDGTIQTSASTLGNFVGDVTSSGTTTTYARVVPAAKGGAGTVSGLLKANGSGLVSAAVAGTDYATATGSTAYVQNTTTPQAGSNFNISGAGTVGGLLTVGTASVGGSARVGGNATVAGSLGIGTTGAPAHPLTVQADASNRVMGMYTANGTDKYNWSLSSDGLDLSESNVAAGRIFVQNGGNVGIGTTGPNQKLEVAGNIKISGPANGLIFPDGTTQTTAAATPNLTGDITSTGAATTYNNVVPAAKGGAGLLNGILKGNGNGVVTAARAIDFPTLDQNTTGNAATATLAATVTTNANLTGAITSTGNATSYAAVVPAAKGGAGSVSGLLKANGSGLVSAAVAGTDYAAATGSTAYIQNGTSVQPASFNVGGAGTVGGVLTAGVAIVANGATVNGSVGVGTTIPTQKLDVRGNVRLGADGGNVAGLGQTVEFVGPGFNTDPVGLYRTNPAADASELRVVVGDVADANDKFAVGRMDATTSEGGIPTGAFTPNFTVRSDGNVGVGTGTPTSTFQVNGSVAASIRALSSGTIAATDYTVIVTGNVSLPAPDATNVGRIYHLITGNPNNYTVTGTFRDAGSNSSLPSFTLGTGSGSKGLTVQSDGTQWWIITRE